MVDSLPALKIVTKRSLFQTRLTRGNEACQYHSVGTWGPLGQVIPHEVVNGGPSLVLSPRVDTLGDEGTRKRVKDVKNTNKMSPPELVRCSGCSMIICCHCRHIIPEKRIEGPVPLSSKSKTLSVSLDNSHSRDSDTDFCYWCQRAFDTSSKTTRRSSGYNRILCWNIDELSVQTVSVYVARFLTKSPASVKKVIQVDGKRRFDIYISDPKAICSLNRFERATGARVREDLPPARRKEGHVRKPTSALMDGRVMTLNVNGITSKVLEVSMLLEKVAPMFVALQETRRAKGSFRIRLPNYTVIERQRTNVVGSVGIALGVRRKSGWTIMEMATEDYMVCSKAVGKSEAGIDEDILLISVYIPVRLYANKRMEARKGLKDFLNRNSEKFKRVIVMGDFNMKPPELLKYVSTLDHPFEIVPKGNSSEYTRESGTCTSTIDYILVRRVQSGSAQALTSYDISDHKPVVATVVLPQVEKTPRRKIDASKLCRDIAEDAEWGRILDNGELALSEKAVSFINAVWEITQKHGAVNLGNGSEPKIYLSKETMKAIQLRKAYYACRRNADFNHEKYRDLWLECQKAKRADKRKLVERRRERMCRLEKEGDTKEVWKVIGNLTRRKSRTSVRPIKDKDGVLVMTEDGQAKVWADHFGKLAKDSTGNSRSKSKWKELIPEVPAVIEECNDPLTWVEVTQSLRKMRRGKAAGKDGIPAELLKLVEREEEPTSPLAKVIYTLVKRMWDEADIPNAWESAVVVPVPKKGDLSLVDNYRGIALIGTTAKLVLTIAASRLNSILEDNNILSKEQAGFRNFEECVAQATTLVEVATRRQIKGSNTIVCFLDFSKAYDRVPHEGILRKLESLGIGGNLHAVIKAAYKNPQLCVRTGNQVSTDVPYLCGVRQGCPSSPLLFDAYINDLPKELVGVSVPGLGEEIKCLMFADDAVIFAESEADLNANLHKVQEWCDKWEMKLNIGKCGVMNIHGDRTISATVGVDTIPIVDVYTYLGIDLDNKLDKGTMIKRNLVNGNKCLMGIIPFLSQRSIPLYFRVKALKGILLPVLYYGAEIWGLSSHISSKLQTLANRGVRAVLGFGRNTPIQPCRKNIGIEVVAHAAAKSRLRGLRKWKTSKTYISDLIIKPMSARKSTWVSGSLRWKRRFIGAVRESSEEEGLNLEFLRRERVNTLHERESNEFGMPWDDRIVKFSLYFPHLSKDIETVLSIRVGRFYTGVKLAWSRCIDRRYLETCICCGMKTGSNTGGEDIIHFLLECPEWEVYRSNLREVSGLPINSPRDLSRSVMGGLLGGELVFGCMNGDVTPGDVKLLAVCRFLHTTIHLRAAVVSLLLTEPLRTSWNQGPMDMMTLDES